MARHNVVFLTARVLDTPNIRTDANGNYLYGMCYVDVVRGFRKIDDDKKYTRHDRPLIMSAEPEILEKMQTWRANDIVFIKGTVACKSIPKSSVCPNEECITDPNHPEIRTKNKIEDGSLVYVNPIFVEKRTHFEDSKDCEAYLVENREISNQVYVIGTLCREPKKFKTKKGLVVTQYQIALNRKFRIRSDTPEIKTDYPWVKSYGDTAIEDKMRLDVGSVVAIDGVLQARRVTRKCTCANCGMEYNWEDKAMEIVPYEVEYMRDYKTDEDLQTIFNEDVDEIKKKLKGYTDSDEDAENVLSMES